MFRKFEIFQVYLGSGVNTPEYFENLKFFRCIFGSGVNTPEKFEMFRCKKIHLNLPLLHFLVLLLKGTSFLFSPGESFMVF